MIQIALIGKPNVGKSSLFNLLAKERIAITSEIPGTTRDFKKMRVKLDEKEFVLVDTGGIEERDEMFCTIKKNSIQVAKTSDIVLFMVDGNLAIDNEQKKIFYEIQSEVEHIALIVNKIDSDKHTENVWNFYEFGTESIFPISVAHARGTLKLKEWLHSKIPTELESIAPVEDENDFDSFLENFDDSGELKEREFSEIKVAILGRPNVGKSSLLNAILGEDRAVVSPIAGTTIDPVDESITYKDMDLTFVDTAGVRKRGKIEGIEKYALYRTEKMLSDADIAILVLDSSESFKDLDEKIAGIINKFRLGVIVVFNKWDISYDTYAKIMEEYRFKFNFLGFAPTITLSAMTKRHIDKLKDKILEVFDNLTQRIPTSVLNRVVEEATNRHKIPSLKGKMIKIYYATQFSVNPPRVALIMNKAHLHFSYKRYLVNFLRDNFNFEGVLIDIVARKRGEREEDKREE